MSEASMTNPQPAENNFTPAGGGDGCIPGKEIIANGEEVGVSGGEPGALVLHPHQGPQKGKQITVENGGLHSRGGS